MKHMIYTINLILGGGTEVRWCNAENQINFNKDRKKKAKGNVLVAGIEQLVALFTQVSTQREAKSWVPFMGVIFRKN